MGYVPDSNKNNKILLYVTGANEIPARRQYRIIQNFISPHQNRTDRILTDLKQPHWTIRHPNGPYTSPKGVCYISEFQGNENYHTRNNYTETNPKKIQYKLSNSSPFHTLSFSLQIYRYFHLFQDDNDLHQLSALLNLSIFQKLF